MYRLAACCWWLTLATLTLNAGWDLRIAGAASSTRIYWFDLPLVGTLVAWALALYIAPNPAPRPGPLVPLSSLAGLMALALLSATVAGHPQLALAMGARLLLLLLFYLYTLNRLGGYRVGQIRARRQLACALALGLALQSVVALGQMLRQASLGLGMLGERTVSLQTAGAAVVDMHGRHWLRPYGLTAHPNVLGGFVAASLLPIALWLPRGLARVAVPGCVGLLLLTLSRGAALAALCGVVLYVAAGHRLRLAMLPDRKRPWQEQDHKWSISRRAPLDHSWSRLCRDRLRSGPYAAFVRLPRSLWVMAGSLALAGLLVLTPAGMLVAARFNAADPLEQFSVSERLSSESTALRVIAAHPLLGVGADNYLAVVQAQSTAGEGDQAYVPVVHNAYALAAAEIGPAGAALLIAALLWPAWRLLRHAEARGAGAAAGCGLVACAVVGLVDFYPWSLPAFTLVWGTLLGVWAAGVGPAPAQAAGAAA